MNDLVEALKVTPEEVMLVAEMIVCQDDNPLWIDARQWQSTASNLGELQAGRPKTILHYLILKLLLGDYG